jgi:aminobenzoyl-glutamate utilization protein B
MRKIFLALAVCSSACLYAQQTNTVLKEQAIADLQTQYNEYKTIAFQIWDFAEVGYKETKSSALLQETLKKSGFIVEPGVADIPTAFVATYGSGKPVIGILAEFDALPWFIANKCPGKTKCRKRCRAWLRS